VIRFVSVNGMKEGELARCDQTRCRAGSRGLTVIVTAVVNHGTTGGFWGRQRRNPLRYLDGDHGGELTRE
jgi:hypothetical protein